MEFSDAAPILQAAGMAEATDDSSWQADLADRLGVDPADLADRVRVLDGWGLLYAGEEGLGPSLRLAGRQYLQARGEVPGDVLGFLPRTLDDLHTRRAILHAGSVLVDEFGLALAQGAGAEYARDVVPRAFSAVITDRLAVDLFAATVALVARLTHEEPAMCVAEEIMAVELMSQAQAWLDMDDDLSEDDRKAATSEIRGLFELFQDDDVLNMFAMREPADAAVQRESDQAAQMGIADQSVEAWFAPFFGTPAAGHLVEPEDRPRPGRDLPARPLTLVEPAPVDVSRASLSERFRVAIRTWESTFADRDEFDQTPDAWAYYVDARTPGHALADVLARFPDGASSAMSTSEQEVVSLDSDRLAHIAIDVQRLGIDQALKHEGEFHILGSVDVREELLPALAANLEAAFPVAVVALQGERALVGISANAGSYQEAELDLEDVLTTFAADHGLEDDLLTESATGLGGRDADALTAELGRFD